jgi:hypothetical protein
MPLTSKWVIPTIRMLFKQTWGRFAVNTSMVKIEQDVDNWDEKILTNLDSSNNSTSSLETRPIERTFSSKYCFALGEVALRRR